MHVNVQRIATTLAAAVLLCGTTFAVPAKASEAVSQNITVERVEGLSDDFMRGVDISSLADIEKAGGKFYGADGKEADLFQILKESYSFFLGNHSTYLWNFYIFLLAFCFC